MKKSCSAPGKKARRSFGLGLFGAFCLAAGSAAAQSPSVEAHFSAAKQAAAYDYAGTLVRMCVAPETSVDDDSHGNPPPSAWYAPPAKVFDNLYWVGSRRNSSWALKTSQGIILMDTLHGYSVEPEIVEGLKKLGLDPASVKYVIITHGHSDHDEGAKLFQDRYGSHVILGAPDWDLIENGPEMLGGKPKRDMVASDGQKLTLGDSSVTIITTPGHTDGTLSMIFNVMDRGKPLTVVFSGGTAIAGSRKNPAQLQVYIDSQHKLDAAAARANATVLLSNHSEFDNAYMKTRALASRGADDPNPFFSGRDGVTRYFKVTSECALAAQVRAQEGAKTQ